MVRVTNILHTARIGMSKCGICALKGSAMEYFKPDEQMRMMYSSVSDTDKLGKRKFECSYQESNLRPSNY